MYVSTTPSHLSLLLLLLLPLVLLLLYTDQEIRQALVDMAYMTKVLNSFTPAVPDAPNAVAIEELIPLPPPAAAAVLRDVEHRQDHRQHDENRQEHRQHDENRQPATLSPTITTRKYQFFSNFQQKKEYKTHIQSLGNNMNYIGSIVGSTIEFRNVNFSYRKVDPNNKGIV